MHIFTTKILNKEISLNYEESEKDRLVNAVNKINEIGKKYNYQDGKISDTKILSLIAIELQDSINEISKKSRNDSNLEIKFKEIQNENIRLKDIMLKLKEKISNYENENSLLHKEITQIQDQINEIINIIKDLYDE